MYTQFINLMNQSLTGTIHSETGFQTYFGIHSNVKETLGKHFKLNFFPLFAPSFLFLLRLEIGSCFFFFFQTREKFCMFVPFFLVKPKSRHGDLAGGKKRAFLKAAHFAFNNVYNAR